MRGVPEHLRPGRLPHRHAEPHSFHLRNQIVRGIRHGEHMASAGFQDPADFFQGAQVVGDVLQHVLGHHQIETAVVEGRRMQILTKYAAMQHP